MKWEDLTKEEQQKWNELGIKYAQTYRNIMRLSKDCKCIACRTKFSKPILIGFDYDKDMKPINLRFTGEFLVHYKTTHGIHWEDFNIMANEVFLSK